MKFTVQSALTIRPRPHIYFSGLVGKEQSTRLLFHSNDGKPIKIEKIRFEDPAVKLSTEPFDPQAPVPSGFKPQAGDVWLIARVLPNAEAGTRKTKAWITTSNPKAPEIQIPVVIAIRPLIEAMPMEVRLQLSDAQAGNRSEIFRLKNNGGKLFTITSIEVADPGFFAASIIDPKASQVQSVRVQVLDGIGPKEIKKGVESKIVIHTSDLDQPLVTVPVHLIPRQALTRSRTLPSKPVLKPRPFPTGTPHPYPTGTPHPGHPFGFK